MLLNKTALIERRDATQFSFFAITAS